MNAHHQRASMLLNHDRHEEALHELQQAITEEPDNPFHHALQAIALSRLARHQLALEAARKAVQLAPDLDYSHYVLGTVFFDRGQFKEARDAIKTAIQLEPEDADNFAQLARAEYALDHWQAALDAADQGLRLDASNDVCRHWRSQALQQLGRSDEAAKELDTLMAEDPEDAHTHDARGWFLLQQGKPAEARGHFLEALRLQPDLESARGGFANALKSRHVTFSWILRFLIWTDRFRAWTVFAVAAAVFLSMRLGDRWAQTHPDHLVSMAVLKFLVWTLVVLMTVAQPLFDLLLRLDAGPCLPTRFGPPTGTACVCWLDC
jgi:tetratricopeptide (TPR) repeat protein